MDVSLLSGKDRIQQMINGHIPPAPMFNLIPLKITEVDNGLVKGTAVADGTHLNVMGLIHGGFATTVIDTFAGLAVFSTLTPTERHATVDLNVKMLRPVPQNEMLYCVGKVINISTNIAMSEAEMRGISGKLYAHGTSLCYVKR